jgi:hypothetical protein
MDAGISHHRHIQGLSEGGGGAKGSNFPRAPVKGDQKFAGVIKKNYLERFLYK